MDNNYNNDNEFDSLANEQKIKSSGCYFRGLATGVSLTLVVLIIGFVVTILLTKDYIETDDRQQMMDNAWADSGVQSGDIEISDEMLEIFAKAKYIQGIINELYYYDDKDMGDLADGMYEGMLNSLGDPYSVYYDEEAYAALMESITGKYCGIGVVVQQDPESLVITVVNPYEGCPGYEAGMQP